MNNTPENITHLEPNQIFVFGSNLAGRHGGGAAKLALDKFGANYGQGIGLQGQSYALPTLDKDFKKLPLEDIQKHLSDLSIFAQSRPDLQFLLTLIGCGLAGFTVEEIKSILPKFPDNVLLPIQFNQ